MKSESSIMFSIIIMFLTLSIVLCVMSDRQRRIISKLEKNETSLSLIEKEIEKWNLNPSEK